MAESMIERVAQAILKARFYDCEPEAYGDSTETFFAEIDDELVEGARDEARAAIEAMREPTGAMTAAGIKRSVAWEYGDRGDPDEPPHVGEVATYTAMIDAALAEETKP